MQIAAPWSVEKTQRPEQETLAAMNTRLVSQMRQLLSEIQSPEVREWWRKVGFGAGLTWGTCLATYRLATD